MIKDDDFADTVEGILGGLLGNGGFLIVILWFLNGAGTYK